MIEIGEYVRTKKGKIFKYGKGRTYIKEKIIVICIMEIVKLL